MQSEILSKLERLTLTQRHQGLVALANKWMKGEFKDAPVIPEEGHICLKQLEKTKPAEFDLILEQDIEESCHLLIKAGVHVHYSTTASHRKHLQQVLDLFIICDVFTEDDKEEIKQAVKVHDWSKYGPDEAIGYGIMFGVNKKFRKLNEMEAVFWERSLKSHFASNSHHPQYHTKAGSDKLEPMDKINMVESVIDMLACVLERELEESKVVKVNEFFEISDKFLERYLPSDREAVKQFLGKAKESVNTCVRGRSEDSKLDEGLKNWERQAGKAIIVCNK